MLKQCIANYSHKQIATVHDSPQKKVRQRD